MSIIEDLVADMRDLSEDLVSKVENLTSDSTLLHRFVELKKDLMSLADFLEDARIKGSQSD